MSPDHAVGAETLVDDARLEALAAGVLARTIELAAVPAPTGAEQARAALVAQWWRHDGFADVTLDDVGNCWAQVRGGEAPALVIGAHLDTVFGPEADHVPKLHDGRLYGLGVGDNSVAVAALGAIGELLDAMPGTLPVYLLATVGEEGLGDLVGARYALSHPIAPIGAFLALEGNYLGRIASVGVGSRRWRVVLEGPGGHAWERSSAPSALHEAARLVHELSGIETIAGTSSLNVGTLIAGEAVNARARHAAFDLDVRGADEATLAALEIAVRAVLDSPLPEGVGLALTPIGNRPAGRIDSDHPLLAAARDALEARGVAWRAVATSTDANAAHLFGLPALALGVTTGEGEHTPGEWIDTGPIATGIVALADTVRRYEAALDATRSVPGAVES